MATTEWVENGLSNDTTHSGDGVVSGDIVSNDPVPIYEAGIQITTWTEQT